MTLLRSSLWLRALLRPLLLLILLGLTAPGTRANTYNVAPNGSDTTGDGSQSNPFQTIGKGIATAAEGDIVLLADGTYFEQNLDFGGKNITIASANNAPTRCILDCRQIGRGFNFHSGETSAAKVFGLTIQNGNTGDLGGGIYCIGSSPFIFNCVFTGNSAYYGGGMATDPGSNPFIIHCTFTGNSAFGGGGITNTGSGPILTDCTFNGNAAGNGGGGAMYNGNGTLTVVTSCVFTGNTSPTSGGAMYNNQGSSATITNGTFAANTADEGGAMLNFFSHVTATNCAFYGNSASTSCGGMFNGNTDSTLINCTFTGNGDSRNDGGGGMLNIYSFPTVTNCILWGDADGEIRNTNSSATVSYSIVQGGYVGTGNSNSDPLFANASSGDLRLQAGSPAIDAGNDAVVTSPPFRANGETIIDLTGNPRIYGAHVDIGAYERQANQTPVANAGSDQTVTVPHDGNPATNTAHITLNASASYDPDGDALTYSWTGPFGFSSNAVNPSVDLAAGLYFYIVKVSDEDGAYSFARVYITVNPEPNQPPTANAQSLSTSDQTALPITLTGSDPDGDSLTYSVATHPANGTLTGTAPNLTYTPNVGFIGSDSFTFTVTDPYGATSTAAISFNIHSGPIVIKPLPVPAPHSPPHSR